jgi:hypothetical protein
VIIVDPDYNANIALKCDRLRFFRRAIYKPKAPPINGIHWFSP